MTHATCRCGWVSDPTGEHGPIVQIQDHARIAHVTLPGVRYSPGESP